MTQELYINDQLVDLGKDANIYLQFNGVLFNDISTIGSNGSFAISIPKTPTNLAIIEYFHLADRADEEVAVQFPRRYHKVDYFRNGIAIAEGGIGTVGLINDVINFSFVWGVVQGLANIGDKMLTELPEPNIIVPWNNTSTVTSWNDSSPFSAGYLFADFGNGTPFSNSDYRYQRPMMRSSLILNLIEQQNEVVFERDTSGSYPYGMGDFVVPLIQNKADYRTLDGQRLVSPTTGMRYGSVYGTKGGLFLLSGALIPQNYTDPIGLYTDWDNTFDAPYEINMKAFSVYAYVQDDSVRLIDVINYYDDNNQVIFTPTSTFVNSTTIALNSPVIGHNQTVNCYRHQYRIDAHRLSWGMENTGVRAYCNYGMLWVTPTETRRYVPSITGTNTGFYIVPSRAEMSYPSPVYPLSINLPEIKQIDFMKTLMHLTGSFAYKTADGKIGFTNVESVIESEAQDWTDKLIIEGEFSTPAQIDFKLDGFAKRNNFKYKEDTATTQADGYIEVANETIETGVNIVELEFAFTDWLRKEYPTHHEDDFTYANIPLYNGADIQTTEPRILVGAQVGFDVSTPGNVAYETFGIANSEGLRFGEILRMKYAGYKKVVESPRVLKEKCRISDFELSTLNATRKVYLGQYGRNYAIRSLRSLPSNICEVELIEIE